MTTLDQLMQRRRVHELRAGVPKREPSSYTGPPKRVICKGTAEAPLFYCPKCKRPVRVKIEDGMLMVMRHWEESEDGTT